MLRNQRELRDGKRVLGLPWVGPLGSDIPATGDGGRPALSYNDVQVNNIPTSRSRIWITSHNFPNLFVDDYGAGTADSLVDGTFSAFGVLIVDGVDQGAPAEVLRVTVGTPVAPTTRSVSLNLVALNQSPIPGLSGLKWAFFDQATPDQFLSPSNKGSIESTDGAGLLVIDLPNTSLPAGGVGWLTITDSNGTTTQNPAARAFSGPVTVA